MEALGSIWVVEVRREARVGDCRFMKAAASWRRTVRSGAIP
jgi:hypothetical protein